MFTERDTRAPLVAQRRPARFHPVLFPIGTAAVHNSDLSYPMREYGRGRHGETNLADLRGARLPSRPPSELPGRVYPGAAYASISSASGSPGATDLHVVPEVRRSEQHGHETAEHQRGQGPASVELGMGAQGPDKHQGDHQHFDLEHQLERRPSWVDQHCDARTAQTEDGSHNAARQRGERPWPDRDELRGRENMTMPWT